MNFLLMHWHLFKMFYGVVNSPNELFCICDCLLTVMKRDERDVHLCNRN
jgi:hypothetical protein